MKLFIDTWGWLTLRDRRESRHQEAVTYYRDFRLQHGIAYTSDYVLDETITLLFRRLPFTTARDSLENIKQAIDEGYLILAGSRPSSSTKPLTCDSSFRINLASLLRISFRWW